MLRLRSLAACAALLVSLTLASPARAQLFKEPSSTVSLEARDARVLRVSPGETNGLLEFTVDPQPGGGDIFDIVTQDSQTVVTLLTPGGAEIGGANAFAQGYGYQVVPAEPARDNSIGNPLSIPGTHTLFMLPPGSVAGAYKVRANAAAATADVFVIATYISHSPVRLGAETDSLYRVDDPVVLAGLLFNGSAPLVGGTVTATIEDTAHPDAPITQVTLADSGDADEAPGDGIYTALFYATTAGKFNVTVRATGTGPSGSSYSRVATTVFEVMSPPATFSSFSDQAADDNSDGLTDRVVVKAHLSVAVEGDYRLALALSAPNGAKVNAVAPAHLLTGNREIAVSFRAQEIKQLGVDGPYAIQDALLTKEIADDSAVADFRESAGNTSAYLLSSLQRPRIFFTGQNSGAGLDTNRNGKFDTLRVTAQVNVVAAGVYEWSGLLTDVFQREIGFYTGAASLTAGNNFITFEFEGSKIGQSGVNGPYAVQSVLINNGADSAVIDNLFSTLPYSVTEFENALIEGDLNGDRTVNDSDVQVVVLALGTRCGDAGYNAVADINQDCIVDDYDLNFVKQDVGTFGRFDGGGQRPRDVNRFLTYDNPTSTATALPPGTTSFPLTIYYGSTVHITSFRAVLNGVDITSQFSPAPGGKQTVNIQLPQGRSVLQFTAEGELPSRTATDSDRLVLDVP
jgi:hypothetical protein